MAILTSAKKHQVEIHRNNLLCPCGIFIVKVSSGSNFMGYEIRVHMDPDLYWSTLWVQQHITAYL